MSQQHKITPQHIKLFRYAILFQILWGAHAWFTWTIDSSRPLQYVAYIVIAVIAYKYQQKERIRIKFTNSLMLAIVAFALGTLFYNRFSLPSLASVALMMYPVCVLVSDIKNTKGHLAYITKALAIILIPGILLSFTNLPGIPMYHPANENSIFFNQILNLRVVSLFEGETSRFQSIFLEPGYMASLLSFILYAVKYNFKRWENVVILIAIIVSFSLAGYIITFAGYTIYLLTNKDKVKEIIIFGIVIASTYYISLDYNNGQNLVNEMIIQRLEYDEEKGIAGNNRTGEGTEFYYNQAIENGDIWLGLGQERVNKINAGSATSGDYSTNIRGDGYKVYFVKFGIISALMFLLFYMMLAKVCNKRLKTRLSFVVLIMLTFMSQAIPTSMSWIYPIILGLQNYNFKE